MDLNEGYLSAFADIAGEIEETAEALKKQSMESAEKDSKGFELRDKLEKLYLKRISLLYRTARLFHPLSGFGRLALENALAFEENYQEEVGVLTSRVTDDSIRKYKSLLSADIMEDIMVGRLQAIGALRYRDKNLYAAGVLAYRIDTDRLSEGQVLRIEWLYTATEFREEGIATHLLGNLIGKCADLGIDYITFDFPSENEWSQAFFNIFSDWHFELEDGIDPEFRIKASKENESRFVDSRARDVKSLSSVSDSEYKEILDLFAKSDIRLRQLLKKRPAQGYFDPRLSAVCLSKKNTGGLLLAHRMPGGLVRTEYLGWTEAGGYALKALVSHLAVSSREVFGEGTLFSVPVESDELEEYLGRCFDSFLVRHITEASLSLPTSDENAELEEAYTILGETLGIE